MGIQLKLYTTITRILYNFKNHHRKIWLVIRKMMQDYNSIYNAVNFFLSEHLRPKRRKQLSFWTFRPLKSRIQRILYFCTTSIVFGLGFIWNFEPLKVLRLYGVGCLKFLIMKGTFLALCLLGVKILPNTFFLRFLGFNDNLGLTFQVSRIFLHHFGLGSWYKGFDEIINPITHHF